MSIGGEIKTRTPSLRPVEHRGGWIAGGLVLQLVGIGVPLAYIFTKAKHESIGDALTVATVRLAWHQYVHTTAGVADLSTGAVIFAIGSILLARPFAKRKRTLLVAVPLAAICGALILGVGAVIVGLIVLILWNGDADIPGFGGSSRSAKKRQPDSSGF